MAAQQSTIADGSNKPTRPGGRGFRPWPVGIGLVWLVVAFYPVYYMFTTSLRTPAGFLKGSLWLPPANPTLENYVSVVNNGIGLYFVNSAFFTVITVALIIFVSFLAAYAIARIRSRIVTCARSLASSCWVSPYPFRRRSSRSMCSSRG